MSTNYPSGTKRCVSCEYWDGPRDLGDSRGSSVTVDQGARGACKASSGLYRGQQQDAEHGACNSYTKWRKLD